MDNSIAFDKLVKLLRRRRGVTQQQFAKEFGVTYATVNGWENGRHKPLPLLGELLCRLAHEADIALPRSEGKPS